MKKLLIILICFLFIFENGTGCSLADVLRKPLTFQYESKRPVNALKSYADIPSDVEQILARLANGNGVQKIAYCIIVRSYLKLHPEFVTQLLLWFDDPNLDKDVRKNALASLLSLIDVKDVRKNLLARLDTENNSDICLALIQGLSTIIQENKIIRKKLLKRLDRETGKDIKFAIIRGLLPLAVSSEDIKKDMLKWLDKEYNLDICIAIIRGLSPLAKTDEDIRKKLLDWLDKELNYYINFSIVKGLLPLAETYEKVRAKLLDQLDKKTNSDDICLAIIQGLSPLIQTDKDVRKKLLQVLDGETQYSERYAIIEGLLPLVRTNKIIRKKLLKLLDEELDNDDYDIAIGIVQVLLPFAETDKDIRESLLKQITYKNTDDSIRIEIIKGLSLLARTDKNIRKKLLERLDVETNRAVRLVIIQSLSPFIDTDKNIRKNLIGRLNRRRNRDDYLDIVCGLSPLARDNEYIRKKLLNQLDTETDRIIRLDITRGLSPFAETNEDVMEKLSSRLYKEADYEIRLTIVKGLLPLARTSKAIRTKLLNLLDREFNRSILLALIRGLSPLAATREDVRKGLLKHISDKKLGDDLRLNIVKGLAPLADVDTVRIKLLDYLDKEETSDDMRLAIDRGLSPLASLNEDIAERLAKYLDKKDIAYYIRFAVIKGLLPLAGTNKDITEKIFRYLNKEVDDTIRFTIIQELSLLAPADKDIKKALISMLAEGRFESNQEALMLAYAIRSGNETEYAPYAYMWEDGTMFSVPEEPYEPYHRNLAELHKPYHQLFLSWLGALSSRPLDRFRVSDSSANVPLSSSYEIINAARGRWMGRSLIIKDKTGEGGILCKVKRPDEDISDLSTEAGLWNTLNPDSKGRIVIDCKIINAPVKNAPVFYNNGSQVSAFIYRVNDIKAFTTYAVDWDPADREQLANWCDNIIGELENLAGKSWGYTGLVEYYHDESMNRKYSLEAEPVGCMDDIDKSMRYSNIRAGGKLADISPEHMFKFEKYGPMPAELAKVIRDQCFQLALIAARVSSKKHFSNEDMKYILERIAFGFIHRYAPGAGESWKRNLPVTLKGVSREVLFAMNNMQNGIDMGFDNGPFSAPALVGFSEAIAKTIVEELTAPQLQPRPMKDLSRRRDSSI